MIIENSIVFGMADREQKDSQSTIDNIMGDINAMAKEINTLSCRKNKSGAHRKLDLGGDVDVRARLGNKYEHEVLDMEGRTQMLGLMDIDMDIDGNILDDGYWEKVKK